MIQSPLGEAKEGNRVLHGPRTTTTSRCPSLHETLQVEFTGIEHAAPCRMTLAGPNLVVVRAATVTGRDGNGPTRSRCNRVATGARLCY